MMNISIVIHSLIQKLLLLSMAFMLVACSQPKDDLQAYVAEVKARQVVDIPPIPVMKPYEKFSYAAAELRDPFVPTVIDVPEPEPEQVVDNGIQPNENRMKEILENYSLADLQYVGTLEQDSLWALIRAPDSTIHRVQIGNYMGMNHGQIVAISETQLTLKEIVPEGNGYNERETTVPVVEIN
ncbi:MULTISPECIES: pilus assembly protein PilP [unclassified Methylophaga]|jgi:type IV pilus assembly protein PilP|uniref:pilus assembly protein PilP n=1 Tax=unclassified Methylophaga TaxID=2629249 RepID=UPI000C8CA842|nr:MULTISPECIES: pilus assembly protein PilP [unclassified Methylophaga]MAP27660.1 pilus assembly protein PilP [Methylophaga sp.]HBX58909.1 pilus assembly protein PilP [Methylophaga sp.]HCN98784.1 pilus assembly protein PilP [Methylophaga sp.]|tara:strand:+ start:1566 stop:2114 length:549 start_codon:yes stop_codon:yes gene_type:complete